MYPFTFYYDSSTMKFLCFYFTTKKIFKCRIIIIYIFSYKVRLEFDAWIGKFFILILTFRLLFLKYSDISKISELRNLPDTWLSLSLVSLKYTPQILNTSIRIEVKFEYPSMKGFSIHTHPYFYPQLLSIETIQNNQQLPGKNVIF